ncbi:MAG: Hsp70 family protein [Cohaesibacter sp.]|nr:Hsp70 family protein [Cohaesibacter sp.]
MAYSSYCGLDFGTSNSTIGLMQNDQASLVPVEGLETTIPSTLFFDFEENSAHFGRDAIHTYMEGGEGRMMRSLKSVLGTSTMNETTMIGKERKPFKAVLGLFIAHLKVKAETAMQAPLDQVVMGRPVHFIDHDEAADQIAQNTLEEIARECGFKQVEFEFEPVAAARDFAQSVTQEEVALIIDIGGGTSDFTILRVLPDHALGQQDILANAGIHIGGTDFDRWLSLARVMPLLGYQSPMLKQGRLMPVGYYHDLATWQKINFLYDHQTRADLRHLRREAKEPHLLDRLIELLDLREGHRLALAVEEGKIALSDKPMTKIDLGFLEKGLKADMTQTDIMMALEDGVSKVRQTIIKALDQAQIKGDQISAVCLTGGSTKVPFVRQSLLGLLPNAKVVQRDAFGSVGTGLVLEALHRFA